MFPIDQLIKFCGPLTDIYFTYPTKRYWKIAENYILTYKLTLIFHSHNRPKTNIEKENGRRTKHRHTEARYDGEMPASIT